MLCVVALGGRAVAGPSDWTVHRDPFDPAVIARTKQLLAHDPHADAPFAHLIALYRGSRTVARLEAEYAAAPADWADLVVLARLHRARGDLAGALALFERADALDVHATTRLAIADLRRSIAIDTARDAYDRVLAASPPRPITLTAYRALIELSLADGDHVSADGYYAGLLELEPERAATWIDRGDSAAAAGVNQLALDSYAAAEGLLGSDPARRLELAARRGLVFEAMGEDGWAIAAYERAIEQAPRGYYLIAELTDRIIAIYRRYRALPRLASTFASDWPERTRGYFEWSTLGRIYDELGWNGRAIVAFEHATRAAPWEVATARRLIVLLDAGGRHDEALAQYEAAIRAVPGDASLSLELATRYAPRAPAKALAVVNRLAAWAARDASVLAAIAELESRWARHDLARTMYERVARLEPDDEDHWLDVARSYLASHDVGGALAAWHRIAKRRPAATAHFAELLRDHGELAKAIALYTDAIAQDDTNPAYYTGRAWAHDDLGETKAALADAEHALERSSHDRTRRTARHVVVEILQHTVDADDLGGPAALWSAHRRAWTAAFAASPPDLDAGYLLVDLWAVSPCNPLTSECAEYRHTLERLSALVPDDAELLDTLIVLDRTAEHWDDALERLHQLARVAPARASEVHKRIADVVSARHDAEGLTHEWIDDPSGGPSPFAVVHVDDPRSGGVHGGLRLGLGTTLHGDAARSLTAGAIAIVPIAPNLDAVARLDGAQREHGASAIGESLGLARHVLTTSGFVLAIGAAQRSELRLGAPMGTDRAALATDGTIDLVARHAPLGIGARVEQWLTGTRETSALLELTVELR